MSVTNGKWEFLTAMTAIVVAMVGGAIWIGQLANQVGVNAARMIALEIAAQEIRQREADIMASERDIDRRLNHLEGK